MNKKIITIIVIISTVIIGGTAGFVAFYVSKNISEKASVINFKECVSAGNPIMESYPRQCRTPKGKTFTEDIGNELEKVDIIRISNPRPNQTVKSPLLIEGEARGAWYFEADFPVKLFDSNGSLITIGIAQAQSDWMTENFVSFKTELSFEKPATKTGLLVLEKDNPSDLPENADELKVPVNFSEIFTETIAIKVYFNNSEMDPEFSCNKVFAVERMIPKTQAAARAALEELLKGTTGNETNEGFFTNINPGVKIQSLIIENKTAKVDFDEQLESQVGGSCQVSAIRAQITETLKQFQTVDNVIISINGRTEDILQP